MLVLVTVPLALSSSQIARRWAVEEKLQYQEFRINGRSVTISDVSISGPGQITANILVESPLSAADLATLRQRIYEEVGERHDIELDVHYRL